MNKTININLGGLPFTMDEPAFDLLERYINSIKNHFAHSDSFDEIITDIEIRLAELMQEKTAPRLIVTIHDVEYAIKTMGKPEEFGAESIDMPTDEEPSTAGTQTQEQPKYKTGKKLFRNMQDKHLGGVSSGLAAFLGIQNANWIRLLFIIMTVSGGFGVALYVIMWIFVPQAKTAADYLAMKGEKITVNNIAEFLETEFNNISNQLNDLSDDISGTFKKKEKGGNKKNYGFKSSSVNIDLEEQLRSGLQKVGSFLKPILNVIGIFIIGIFAIFWIIAIVGFVIAIPFLSFVSSTSPIINLVSTLNIFAILAVPIVLAIFAGLKLLFNTNIKKSLKNSLIAFWITNVICFLMLSASTIKEYSNRSNIEVRHELGMLSQEGITLQAISTDHDDRIQIGPLKLANDNQLEISEDIVINILPSENNSWAAIKRISSKGSSSKEAKRNADCVNYNIKTIDQHTLQIPTFLTINKDCKYRNQKVELDLFMPIGATVKIPQNLEWNLGNITYDKDQMKNGWIFLENKTYKMTEKGIQCTDCTEDELTTNNDPVEYDDYIDTKDLPTDYSLQQYEIKKDIAWNKHEELRVSFDKILSSHGDKIKFSKIDFNIIQSKDSSIHVTEKIKLYTQFTPENSNYENAYGFKQVGNEITFANAGYIGKHMNAKNPSVVVTLALPVGTKVRFDDSVNDFDAEIMFDVNEINGGWRFVKNELLEMGTNGLKCINCK